MHIRTAVLLKIKLFSTPLTRSCNRKNDRIKAAGALHGRIRHMYVILDNFHKMSRPFYSSNINYDIKRTGFLGMDKRDRLFSIT